MSESGPGVGGAIFATFLLVCGLCVLLVGGGCTITWLVLIAQSPREGLMGLPLLAISAAVAWLGFIVLRTGLRMFRGG